MIPELVLSAATALALLAMATPAQAALPSCCQYGSRRHRFLRRRFRGNRPSSGDDASTMLVQSALTAKGFKVKLDGRYSRATTAAYAKYQRSLGYKGIDANGIPGQQSLTKLGKGRFTVANVVRIGSRHSHYGSKRVNTRTRHMLAAADRTLPWKIKVTQGSYCVLEKSGCATASAGTHDGGGSIDIKATSLSKAKRWRTVQALRRVGFAAWLRVPSQCGGCWHTHIHAVASATPTCGRRTRSTPTAIRSATISSGGRPGEPQAGQHAGQVPGPVHHLGAVPPTVSVHHSHARSAHA